MGKKRLAWLFVIFIVHTGFSGLVIPGYAGAQTVALKQSSLDNITPTWSRKLITSRFKLVMGGEAVLDRETGLVWEKSPDTSTKNWANAITYAYTKEVGGRKGWRLPTVEELASLVDSTQNNPSLPSGHPFTNVQSFYYWSSTTNVNNSDFAWVVYFGSGSVGSGDKGDDYYVWCVRGGHGYDAR